MTTANNAADSLHVLNPLDWLRLGWSLFVKPEKLTMLRDRDGDEQIRPIDTLLANLMLWMPFMVIGVAFTLERLPYSVIDPYVNPGLWPLLILTLWTWTVIFDQRRMVEYFFFRPGARRFAGSFIFGWILGLRFGLQLVAPDVFAGWLIACLLLATTLIAAITAANVARINTTGMSVCTALGLLTALVVGLTPDSQLGAFLGFIITVSLIVGGFFVVLHYHPERKERFRMLVARLANKFTLIIDSLSLVVLVWICYGNG